MAAAKKGRPSKYRPEYCDALVDHMRRGQTFESFGANIGVAKDTLYQWIKRHTAFSDARKRGFPLLELYYVQMGQRIALGQVRRVVSEEPMLDKQGRPIRDPKTGELLLRKEFAQANTSATAWIFLCKNLVGFRDVRDVNLGGQEANPLRVRTVTREERLAQIAKLAARRKECGDD